MEHLLMAMIQSDRASAAARSALPDAPVVAPRPHRQRAVRARSLTAHLLERAAAAVAPRPVCVPTTH